MKTLINQFAVSNSKRFENNISNVLPSGVESFVISSFGMQRASGHGSYNYVMDVEINGESVTLKEFTHDSVDFDYFTDLEKGTRNFENWTKRRVLNMLSTGFINDEIFEIANKEVED